MIKRRLLFVAFTLITITALLFSTFAHPGRTDARGGHTNRTTGEYHFHNSGSGSGNSSTTTTPRSSTTTRSSGSTAATPTKPATATASANKTNYTFVEGQKYVVSVEKASVYDKASVDGTVLVTAPEGYKLTPTSSTKSYWIFEFKKKDDDTKYTGYILKSDTEPYVEK